MGWMLQKQEAKKIGFADISDLLKDPMILWQHKYYPFVSIGAGVVLPTLIASLWGDARVHKYTKCNEMIGRIFLCKHVENGYCTSCDFLCE